MIRGLPASIAIHAVVIGAGYLAWPYVGTSVVEDEFVVVPVELVDVGEITNVAPVIPREEVQEPEEEPEPAPPEPEPEESDDPVEEDLDMRDVEESEVATAAEAAAAEPEVEDVVPDLDAEPEERPEPEEDPPEQPKPNAPNPRQDANPLDDFLNSAESTFESEKETKRATRLPERTQEPLLSETPPAQEPRRGAGDRSANTVRIEQLLYNQIYPCWDGVSDQPEPQRLNVSMRLELDAEGNLVDIELVRPSRAPIGDRSMSLAIERALRAVRKCQPYRLPRDDYELWKTPNINLGPAFTDD